MERQEVKEWEKFYRANSNQKKPDIAILVLNKISPKGKTLLEMMRVPSQL